MILRKFYVHSKKRRWKAEIDPIRGHVSFYSELNSRCGWYQPQPPNAVPSWIRRAFVGMMRNVS